MECPFCRKQQTFVINTRSTSKNSKIWRRRKCQACDKIFTTHESPILSHLTVVKTGENTERFSRVKLYSGIYGATIGSKTADREYKVDKITQEAEREILFLNKKHIKSKEIANIVLEKLIKFDVPTFMRFLAYNKNIKSKRQLKKEVDRYYEST